jgi:hypothetical protein
MPTVMFRSTFNRVLSVLAWAAAAAAVASVVLTPGAQPGLYSIPLGAVGFSVLVWVLLWSPYLRINDDGVLVANIFQEYRVPWAALIHVDTQYSLTLHTPARRIRVTAAPAPGQLAAFRATRAEKARLGRLTSGDIRPGDLPGTDSGTAAELVRSRWESLRDSGRVAAGVADQTPVATRVRTASIGAVAIATTAIVVAVLSV